ncbi:sialate O-acetylesterase [Botrimarina sp.]|uniref:sialate O-acetylesterase n=1 Tax=Botrimarina sp. TaxID=2795802 RepID=UPI0032EF7730
MPRTTPRTTPRPRARFASLLVCLAACPAIAEVELPMVFSHRMVMQRDAPAPVWGTAAAGEGVQVSIGGQRHEATADGSGRWRVTLDPLSVGEPLTLRVSGDQTDEPVVVRDVLVGDVWICSGQSNMEWPLSRSRDADLARMSADRPQIRLLEVDQLGCQEPLGDIDQAWKVCSPEAAESFSAVGYFFGVQLNEALDVPIGLVRNAWGGSACEAWAPMDRLEGNEAFADYLRQWREREAEHDEAALRADYAERLAEFYERRDAAYAAGEPLPERPWVNNPLFGQNRPANLYNARVLPLAPMAIKGVIWYQGESNAGRHASYRELFATTIRAWRDAWGQGDFPFYWVQLADFRDEARSAAEASDWAHLREAQSQVADDLPATGQAVIIDLGEANDIHPQNKRDVGLRLARLALADTYGKGLEGRSPRFDSLETDGTAAVAVFRRVAGKLCTFDGVAPRGFAIAGEDKRFYPAEAETIDKNRIKLTSPEVDRPVAVRYGWANNPRVNVYDSQWLPLTPFRTDDWSDEEVTY